MDPHIRLVSAASFPAAAMSSSSSSSRGRPPRGHRRHQYHAAPLASGITETTSWFVATSDFFSKVAEQGWIGYSKSHK